MIPKFRAWHKENKKMYEVKGIFYPLRMLNLFRKNVYAEALKVSFDDVVVMQSTGLFDKNGVEIFEGDIVKVLGNEFGDDVGVVKLESGTFCLDTEFEPLYSIDLPIEVIGNVYENPELMQEKTA